MASILVVDDEPDNFDVIETFLPEEDFDLHYAANGREAITGLNLYQPDVILLDLMMPELDGLEVCRRIKSMPQWEAVPIIMITALTSKSDLAKCLDAGADDFISKPVNRLELNARLRSMLRIRQQYQQLASFNAQLEQTVQQRTAQLQTVLLQDSLTQLPSRTFLLQRLEQTLAAQNYDFAVVYVDCDQFKLVNGSFGYAVGNQLLKAIAQRLERQLPADGILTRVGEDEFCFLLFNIQDEQALEPFIQAVLQSFTLPFVAADYEIFMSACLGIAFGSPTYQRPEVPLQAADTAMYKAKLRGKGGYQVFDQQMHLTVLNRLKLENDLQRAIQQQEFINYYQPIVQLDTQEIVGFEALVRWQHPQRGMISPAEFIPCLEETGLIVQVGMAVLRQACQQLYCWHQQGHIDLTMSVNLSVRQFACPTLLSDVDQVLAQTGVNPAKLKLEITESAIMENAETAIALTKQLRSRQPRISIDDFGTGYSSLGYLHRFPVDTLKIDRSFVREIQPGNRNFQVVNTVVTLSHQLELSVVAEGIETAQQLSWLQQLGCEFGQGYYFSKPLSAAEVERQFLQPVSTPVVL